MKNLLKKLNPFKKKEYKLDYKNESFITTIFVKHDKETLFYKELGNNEDFGLGIERYNNNYQIVRFISNKRSFSEALTLAIFPYSSPIIKIEREDRIIAINTNLI